MIYSYFNTLLISLGIPNLPAWYILTAQLNSEPIPGGAAWVGTGLLGSVLAWLFFRHLPSKDKQITDLVDGRDKLVKELAETYRQAIMEITIRAGEQDKERRHDYRESLQIVVSYCEKEATTTSQQIRQALNELTTLIGTMRPLIDRLKQERIDEKGQR